MRQSYFSLAILLWLIGSIIEKDQQDYEPRFYVNISAVPGGDGPSPTAAINKLQNFANNNFTRLYVNKAAAVGGDGSSWANAFKYLQDALAAANSGTEIWVAQGLYFPDEGNGLADNDRDLSFNMKNGVEIYGGFTGTEADISQRDWHANRTYLSGDLLQNGASYFIESNTGTTTNYEDNSYHVVKSDQTNETARLDGFLVAAGNANGGNEKNLGGGMYAISSSMGLVNCEFRNNKAEKGGGLYNAGSSLYIEKCIFRANTVVSGGGGVYVVNSSDGYFYNCLFQANYVEQGTSTGKGGAVLISNSYSFFINCTFNGNYARTGGAVYNTNNSTPIFYNTIIWKNQTGLPRAYQADQVVSDPGSSADYYNSILQFIDLPDASNLDGSDPHFLFDLFSNQAPGYLSNLRLEKCSPAIDKGNNGYIASSTDLGDSARFVNGTVDLGAFEFQGVNERVWYQDLDGDTWGNSAVTIVTCTPPAGYVNRGGDCNDIASDDIFTDGSAVNPGMIEVCGDLQDNDCNGLVDDIYTYYRDADGDGLGNPTHKIGSCSDDPPDGYVSNDDDCNDSGNPFTGIIYVNVNATGPVYDGLSWTTAYKNLQDALTYACAATTQIWVAQGTYYPDEGNGKVNNARYETFILRNNVTIYGGFAGGETQLAQRNWKDNATILSGDVDGDNTLSGNSWHVVFNNGNNLTNSARLDGFHITGGNASGYNFIGDEIPYQAGAGMYNKNSFPTVANCVFENNSSWSKGGAVYNYSTGPSNTSIFENCSFMNNIVGGGTGASGGAMYNEQVGAIMINCEFFANEAQFRGGAIYNYGTSGITTVTNCVFYGNISTTLGKDISNFSEGSGNISNCIFWGNNSPIFEFLANHLTVSNSIVQQTSGVYTGTGNLNVDPLFVDQVAGNLRLQAGSPAINAGDDAANNTSYDLDVNPRKVGVIDMGAYEYQGTVTPIDLLCPSNFSVNTDQGLCTAVVNFTGSYAATADNATITYSPVSGSSFAMGVNSVLVTATDAAGNTATCSFTVTVVDNEPPVITPPTGNLTIECDQLTPANLQVSPLFVTSPANISRNYRAAQGSPVANLPSTPIIADIQLVNDGIAPEADACDGILAPGSLTGKIALIDRGTCSFNDKVLKAQNAGALAVIFVNNEPGDGVTGMLIDDPAITIPSVLVSNNTGIAFKAALLTGPVTVSVWNKQISGTNSCGSTVLNQFTDEKILGSCPNTYQLVRTWIVSDASDNTSSATQTVTVEDKTAPAFTHDFPPVLLGCNPSESDINAALGTANATDACGAVTITFEDGEVVPDGCDRSIRRIFTARDGCNNTATTSRTVRWLADETPPEFTGSYADINLGCNPAYPEGALGTATATDACGDVTITSTGLGTEYDGCNRSITRRFTARDKCGNRSVITRTVRWTVELSPPTFTGSYTDINLGCNPVDPSGSLGTATATDVCGAVTITSIDGSVVSNGCNRSITRTFTSTDGCLNTSSTSRTVRWIYDKTSPTLTCAQTGTVTKSTSTDQCSYTVDGAEFNPTASDACGTPSLGWVVTGATSTSGITTMAGVQLNFGYNTIKWTATDGCGNTSTCSFIVHVNKVKTTSSLDVITTPATDPVTQQYSDKITCVATVTPANCTGAGPIGGTVTFKIITTQGTVVLGSAPVASDGTATLTDTLVENQFYPGATNLLPSNGPLKPGDKTVTAVYSNTDADYIVNNPTAPLVVTCEDADITYNGLNYFGANPNTNQGTITVSAFVLDTNDVNDNPAQARGDIRNATVTFKEGSSAGISIGSINIPVGLVNPNNFQEGIVTTNKTYTLTTQDINCGGKIIDVWAGVNNYYCGEIAEVVPVCLSLPGGDFVTGGGWIKMQNSQGSYAGNVDKKMHAALVFKWNKSNKNLQGNATIVYKRVVNGVQKVYQIKSNSITSMIVNNVNDAGTVVTTGATYRMAQIVTKANFRDLTDPDFPITLFGNLTLTITAWESINTTDGSKDRISVQLVGSGSQGLIFSSNWISGTTLWQQIGGGKMRVRNPSLEIPCSTCSGSSITAKTGENNKTVNAVVEASPEKLRDELKVVAIPNPSSNYFRINARSNNKAEKITVQVSDVLGRIIETRSMYADEMIQFGDRYRPGMYFVRFVQGKEVRHLKLVKSPD